MAHPDYVAATKQMIDVRAAVGEYRANATALRRLWGSHPTRNAAATERAIEWRTQRQRAIELSLCLAGHAVLVGELVQEAKLNKRLAEARRHNIARPELKPRLATTRQRIKILLPL